MKRLGIFAAGAVLLAGVGAVAACSNDDDNVGSSSSGAIDSGIGQSDATTSSSSGSACQPEAAVDANCNYAACTAQLGEKAICNAGMCQKLATEDCADADIFGEYTNDRAVWIGGAMAMIAAGGKINTSGPPRRNSIQFAVDEINGAGGIPGTDNCHEARPLAAIVCDDGGGRNASGLTDVTERVGAHLVNDLGIQAVIGAGTSGPTIAMAQKATLPAKALIIAPSATAIAITDLAGATIDGDRLVWRTAPSDLLQSQALIKLYNGQVAQLDGATKLAIVDKGDVYGQGLGDAFQAGAQLNGASIPAGNTAASGDAGAGNTTANFYRGQCTGVATGDAGTATCKDQVDALFALQPNIVVLPGTAEVVTQVLIPYEARNPATKPIYLLPDGPAKTELFNAVKADPDLALRIQGTVPGAVTALASNFFDLGYKVKFPKVPDTDGNLVDSTLLFGMAGSYDATYLLTYAMVATNSNDRTYTGNQIAKGLAKQISGAQINVGTAFFGQGITALRGVTPSIDFNGASGPLNFDVTTGTAPSDMIIWCVRKNPNSDDYQRYDTTGQTFDSLTGELVGAYDCPL